MAQQILRPRLVDFPAKPLIVPARAEHPVSRLLSATLPTLTPTTPVLIQAGTGVGKTSAILEVVIPYAMEQGLPVWFVSSRAAINAQFKQRLARKLERNDILTDYTPEGLRHLEDIGPIKVLTYHRLWSILNANSDEARSVGILVFDEIHALALDATFVGFTGQLLQRIPIAFSSSLRLYLSATPEPVLPDLAQAEGTQRLTVYRWPAHYQQFRLHFYNSHGDLIDYFNNLPHDVRALIYVPFISDGDLLQKRLKPSCQLISAQTKEKNPALWAQLLETGHLDCQILIATSTLDAGVSLMDPALKHIVCYGLEPAAVLQQAGRKRLKSGERINLYLFNPSRQQLGNRLHKALEELSALNLNFNDPKRFLKDYILGDKFPPARLMTNVECNGTISVNSLSLAYYQREIQRLEQLLRSSSAHPAETLWCRTFKQPDSKVQQLGHQDEQEAKAQLQTLLQQHIGLSLSSKEVQTQFAQEFQQLYTNAYGPRKNDRADRTWRLATCRNVLTSLNLGFTIISANGSWILQQQGGDLHG